MTVKLPDHLLGETLFYLMPGETVYTVPWAMKVDEDLNCYLDLSFACSCKGGGTQELKVTNDGAGYIVDLRGIEYRYQITPHEKCVGLEPVWEILY